MKKTVYIPIELKHRELDSQVLLACYLSKMGYRCYIGSHAAIFKLLDSKNEKSGIYLDKGTLPFLKMKEIRKKCEYIIILDQEFGPSLENPIEFLQGWPSRIYPGTLELIDKYYCVGKKTYLAAKEIFKDKPNSVELTGWPRVDLWGKLGYQIFKEEIENIKRKYGNFYLFVSDFHYINIPKTTKENLTERREGDSKQYIYSAVKKFNNFISDFVNYSKNSEFGKVIIRPHLTEDIRIWRKILPKNMRKSVIRNSDITPWIFASKGVLHRGSTAALQSKISMKPVIYISNYSQHDNLSIQASVSDLKVDVLDEDLNQLVKKTFIEGERKVGQIDEYVFEDSTLAVERIVESFCKLEVKREHTVKPWRLRISYLSAKSFVRSLGLIRHEIMWFFRKTERPSQLHNIPWGIRNRDISRIMKYFNNDELKASKILINLWEISKNE